jgi:hypothetical protein
MLSISALMLLMLEFEEVVETTLSPLELPLKLGCNTFGLSGEVGKRRVVLIFELSVSVL